MSEKHVFLCHEIEKRLRIGESYDILRHDITVAGKKGTLYFIDGFAKDSILNKLEEYFVTAATPEECIRNIPYIEVDVTDDVDVLISGILSGQSVLIVEGVDSAALMDTREYPSRSIKEPENDRVLRGPREGFTETLVFNTALIRRRIRDPMLTMSIHTVGKKSRTDIVVAYIKGIADDKLVRKLETKIDLIETDALSMGQQSLEECLVKGAKWNPFPKTRYTERPDAAAAMLVEGSVIVMCDCYPAAMILPTSFFDFLQESDDFYFPPLVGTYLRLTRMLVFALALFLTPTWYLLISNPDWLPPGLKFILVGEPAAVPVLIQLLLAEFAIDGLKLASLNTPSMLNSSFSVVGALILGDFAVQTGWFSAEVILYMAVVAIANFTQQSYELGYACKFMRIISLIATGIFGIYGYAAVFIFTILLIASNKTVDGMRRYLYPLIPFNARALKHVFIKDK